VVYFSPNSPPRHYTTTSSHRSIQILSTHLSQGHPSGLFPSGFQPRRYTLTCPQSSIVILSTHLRLGHHSGLFPFGFHTRTLYTHLSPQIHSNIIHPSTLRTPQWSLSLRFPHKDSIHRIYPQIHPNIIHPSTPRSHQFSLSHRFPHQ